MSLENNTVEGVFVLDKTKICSKCGEELPATTEYFYATKYGESGLIAMCKRCRRTKMKEYKVNNRENISKYNKEYNKKYKSIHKERLKQYNKEYKEKHKKQTNKRMREYREKRLLVDFKYQLDSIVSRDINNCINGRRAYKWEQLVGYTLNDLINHIEGQFTEGMTWDNHGLFGWHIDHIIPKSIFNYSSPNDPGFKECWALKNLRPLWAMDNIRKSNKY